MMKKIALVAVVAILVMGTAACSSAPPPEVKVVAASPESCAAILGKPCDAERELLVLRTQVNDGQKATPDMVAKQLEDHRQLLNAMAKVELERRKAELALRALASEKPNDPCAKYANQGKAQSVCQILQ